MARIIVVARRTAAAPSSSWNIKATGAWNSWPKAAVQVALKVVTGFLRARPHPAASACCHASQSPVEKRKESSYATTGRTGIAGYTNALRRRRARLHKAINNNPASQNKPLTSQEHAAAAGKQPV